MPQASDPSAVVRFGVFEVDLRSGELRKSGVKVRLQDQPFRLLCLLLEHPGELVTREELQRQIWPSDTFVDFDRGLNNAVKRLREALGDPAETPRYIETLPRRGYRFIAPLVRESAPERAAPVNSTPEAPVPLVASAPPSTRHGVTKVGLGALAVAVVLAAAGLASNVDGLRDRLFGTPVTPVATPTIHSLAVIPLANLSADPSQEYFSDGITDALITELAQLRSIRVISRTSVMRYKKTNKTSPEIARELGVDGIVEGTLQRSGDRVRITVQLIYAPADKHLWATVYERDLKDVFVVERELTEEIARHVQAEINSDGRSLSPPPRPVIVQALEAYLQGKQHLDRVGRGAGDEEKKIAATYLNRAVALDPTFVEAYKALADAHCYLLIPGSEEDAAIISEAKRKVAELDPSSRDFWESPCAREKRDKSLSTDQQYRACIARIPNNVEAHREFAGFLDRQGRLDEGWQEQQIAWRLDPNPNRIGPGLDLPGALFRRGRYDDAIALLLRIVESEPLEGQTHLMLADCYKVKGMNREEIEEFGRTAASYGHPEMTPRLRESFAASGYQGALRRLAREFEELQDAGQFYAPTYLAKIYLRIDDRQQAYKLLEEAYAFRTTRRSECSLDNSPTRQLEQMRKESKFSSDPSFVSLLRRIGFPQ